MRTRRTRRSWRRSSAEAAAGAGIGPGAEESTGVRVRTGAVFRPRIERQTRGLGSVLGRAVDRLLERVAREADTVRAPLGEEEFLAAGAEVARARTRLVNAMRRSLGAVGRR